MPQTPQKGRSAPPIASSRISRTGAAYAKTDPRSVCPITTWGIWLCSVRLRRTTRHFYSKACDYTNVPSLRAVDALNPFEEGFGDPVVAVGDDRFGSMPGPPVSWYVWRWNS